MEQLKKLLQKQIDRCNELLSKGHSETRIKECELHILMTKIMICELEIEESEKIG